MLLRMLVELPIFRLPVEFSVQPCTRLLDLANQLSSEALYEPALMY
jgi:hypothetical protein